jgi:hypothetical protein
MPQGGAVVKEPRGIPRFVEGIKGDSPSRPIDILSKPIMMRLITKRDLRGDPIDADYASGNEKKYQEYFPITSVPNHIHSQSCAIV